MFLRRFYRSIRLKYLETLEAVATTLGEADAREVRWRELTPDELHVMWRRLVEIAGREKTMEHAHRLAALLRHLNGGKGHDDVLERQLAALRVPRRGSRITGPEAREAGRADMQWGGAEISCATIEKILALCARQDSPTSWRDAALVVLRLMEGLRSADIADLNLEDYDRDRGVLRVEGRGKIPLCDRTRELLDRWREVRGDGSGPLLTSNPGGRPLRRMAYLTISNEVYQRLLAAYARTGKKGRAGVLTP